MTFGSWNVHAVRPVHASAGPNTGAGLDVLHDVDVLALQELEFERASLALAPSSSEFVESLGMPYFVGFPTSASQFDSRLRFGVGLASRYPIRDVRRHFLPNPGRCAVRSGRLLWSHDKGIVLGRIVVKGVTLSVASLHMIPFHMFETDAGDSEYSSIWRDLEMTISGVDEPWIVGGDFNADDRRLFLHGLKGSTSSVLGRSTRSDSLHSHDDVVLSAALCVRDVEIWPTFSDHHMVASSVSLRGDAMSCRGAEADI